MVRRSSLRISPTVSLRLMGVAHTIFALTAMPSGASVLLRRKGTLWHKRLGHLYASCMAGLNVRRP
jgi:uncharacterized membrane protein